MTRPRTTIATVAAAAITAGVLAFAGARLLLAPSSHRNQRAALTLPSRTPPPLTLANARSAAAPARSPGPAGEFRSRFADTEQGAAEAAASFLRLGEAALLNGSGNWSTVIRALAVDPLRSQALAARSAGRLFAAARAAGPWFARSWRLGYQIDAYTPSTAQVAIWTFGIAVGQIPTVTDWSTTTMQLRYTPAGWKISNSHISPGPTPPSPGASAQTKSTFVSQAAQFDAFPDAP